MLRFLFPKRHTRPAAVPQDVRIYAIGDIHGRADALAEKLALIDEDRAARPIADAMEVYLGDYVDRGPASCEVLDRLIARGRECSCVFLKGNHEAFVGGFLEDPTSLGAWSQFGGLETLMSYGIFPALRANAAEQQEIAAAFARRLPQAHRRFLNKLRLSFSCGDYFFAHAGARPGTALADQKEDDLLWIREDFLLHEQDFGKIVVHGHTPVREPDIRPNRINIDTGAYVTGQLTCLLLEGEEMYFL